MAIDPEPLKDALSHHADMCADRFMRTGDPESKAELLDTVGRILSFHPDGLGVSTAVADQPEGPAPEPEPEGPALCEHGRPEEECWPVDEPPEGPATESEARRVLIDPFQLDLIGLILRLRQIKIEGGWEHSVITNRVITCDLPRMEGHLTRKQWRVIRWAEG